MCSRMEHLDMTERDANDTKKIKMKLLEMRNTIFEMTNTLGRINSRSYT